jgi:membrane-associated protein
VQLVLVPIAAIAGNLVGYWIGYQAGPAVFNKPNSRIFRQEYVDRSHDFFEKYGARTIVLARFVPIVRTFATVMAGASRMRFAVYAAYSVVGGVLWGCGVVALGYYLGHIPFVRNTLEPLIEPIIVAVVLLSLVPAAVELIRSRRRRGGMSAAPLAADPIDTDGEPVSGRHRLD